jgi:uncharacterized protein (DUF433 family)
MFSEGKSSESIMGANARWRKGLCRSRIMLVSEGTCARICYDVARTGEVMITPTEHLYIERNDTILSGEPIIKGTRTPVRAIVETWRMGVPPEEIPTRMPHLTLAQVFNALSYFSDHPEEIMEHIERNRIPPEKLHPSVRHL